MVYKQGVVHVHYCNFIVYLNGFYFNNIVYTEFQFKKNNYFLKRHFGEIEKKNPKFQ